MSKPRQIHARKHLKIDGKTFQFGGFYGSKGDAEKAKRSYKARGYKVRILSTFGNGYYLYWHK